MVESLLLYHFILALKTFQLNHTYKFTLFHAVKETKGSWDALPSSSLLLTAKYLETLETYRPENMSFRYAVVYKSSEPIAGFYFQLLPFNAADRLQLKVVPRDSLLSCLYRHLKKLVARKVDFVSLICGNLLATGPYGIKYKSSISYDELQEIFNMVLRTLFEQVELIEHASVCLIKELPLQQKFNDSDDSKLKYFHPFFIQPSMLLHLHPEWKTLDNYISDLQSKYRLRVRKALDASVDLIHKEFGTDELTRYQEEIYQLYFNTADGSDFNLVKLHKEYFLRLKMTLGERYRIFGFFKDQKLIAFYSFFDDAPELLGHFLGTMKENNLMHQIYLNILLKFIEHGIKGNYTVINLARTAIEIKSSVGALPVEMICYLTHRNKIYNTFVPNLIQYLKPAEKHVIRHPFKKAKATQISS